MRENTVRNYGFDNLKFFLMLFVLLGHLLSFSKAPGADIIFRLLYLSHMPLFLFISGFFAKFVPKRTILPLLSIYVVFQFLYIFFERIALNTRSDFQFTQPYWILWYVLALVFYHVLLPLYDVKTTSGRVAAVLVSLVLAVIVGFQDTVGYYLSLSRFFVFQPFFLMGYYFRRELPHIQQTLNAKPKVFLFFSIAVIAGAVLSLLCIWDSGISKEMFYGAYGYSALTYGPGIRIKLLLSAIAWVFLFALILRSYLSFRIPVISGIGSRTLPVFLLHGFVLKLLEKSHPAFVDNWFGVIVVALGCLLLFGNPIANAVVRALFYEPWER